MNEQLGPLRAKLIRGDWNGPDLQNQAAHEILRLKSGEEREK